ncbi:phosphatidylserine decarboxylase [Paenibacillus sp. DS2015]|uniref:archaetidylserine decarboxylase n=1 Tax=Paenibacillus sp. DS2015 TaxID=3373917 RepID=UPI003D221BA2
MAKKIMRLMTELSSRKSISKIMGRFSHSRVSRHFIPMFIKTYQIPVFEAEKDILEYRTLNAFFTRKLKTGMRPIDESEHSLTSPVDGLITAMGPISSGTILNVKGQNYTVKELLHHSPHLELYNNGYVFVLYLSPTNYHRIHSPVTGIKVESEHIKGRVYPVNDFAMTHMPSVLSRNERLITYIKHEFGEIAVVKVGAMNVSSIQYSDSDVTAWDKGDDLAYFEFGSTVVLLTENGSFTPSGDLKVGDAVRMGQYLGHMHVSEQSTQR